MMLPAAAQQAVPRQGWDRPTQPSPGAPRVIGAHGLGCIGGAVALPQEGPGWQVVRLSRNRYWGHPALVTSLESLAGQAQASGLPPLWIGDLGQPRGGPMPSGHASHQTGLDADIWLDLTPRPALTRAAREHVAVASLVRPDGLGTDPARFTPGHAQLIRMAAELPAADRVFVNPAIKKALCVSHAGEPWLRRVRPWWGHDSHMHLRLSCPAGQADCRGQGPLPAGDGCDAGLDWWFSAEARRPARPAPDTAPPPPPLPAACGAVRAAP